MIILALTGLSGAACRALLAVAVVCGVAYPIPGCFSVHARDVQWPGVQARAEGNWALLPQMRPFRFHFINIRQDQHPPPYQLQMPDGRWIPSDQLNRDVLGPYLRPSPYNEPDVSHIRYGGGLVMIVFRTGVAQRVMVMTNRVGRWPQRDTPALRRGDGTAAQALPATQEQLSTIFGNPTRTKDFWFNT